MPDTIERILKVLQFNIASYQERKAKKMMMIKEGGGYIEDEGQGHTFAPNIGHNNKENN